MTELKAGLIITALPLASIVFSAFAGPLSDKIGSRWFSIPGMILLGISIYLMAGLRPDSTNREILWRLIIMGAATGLTLIPIIGATVRSVPSDKVGIASGVGNMSRTIGQVLGVSIIVTLFTHAVDKRIEYTRNDAKQIVLKSTILKKSAKDIIITKLDKVRFSPESRLPSEDTIISIIDRKKQEALKESPEYMQILVKKTFEKQKKEALKIYYKIHSLIKNAVSNAFSDTFKINSFITILGVFFAFFSEPGVKKVK